MNDVNIYIAELAAGSYFAIMAVLFLFIYIGRLSEVFCRLHRKASANASLLIATLIINEEYELTMGQTKKQRRYMRHNCGPMVCYQSIFMRVYISDRKTSYYVPPPVYKPLLVYKPCISPFSMYKAISKGLTKAYKPWDYSQRFTVFHYYE